LGGFFFVLHLLALKAMLFGDACYTLRVQARAEGADSGAPFLKKLFYIPITKAGTT
jgi:hypothetical protein